MYERVAALTVALGAERGRLVRGLASRELSFGDHAAYVIPLTRHTQGGWQRTPQSARVRN